MKTPHILFLLSLVFFEANLFGHEQIVHEAITVNASDSALEKSSAYKDFFNTISSDLPLSGPKSGTNLMRIGSFYEDTSQPQHVRNEH